MQKTYRLTKEDFLMAQQIMKARAVRTAADFFFDLLIIQVEMELKQKAYERKIRIVFWLLFVMIHLCLIAWALLIHIGVL